jgi:hypothetical protein
VNAAPGSRAPQKARLCEKGRSTFGESLFPKSPKSMAKPSSNRRLFQSDGYTFIRWIEATEVERMLGADEIETCFDLRTDRALGFKLVLRQSERIADGASLLPFSRPTRPEDKFRYEIPHAGDCRKVCAARFGLRRKRIPSVLSAQIFTTRVIRVSSRKIDLTAAAYITPAGVLRNSTGQSPSAMSV